MEGNSTWHDLGGWIRHPNCGFQNAIKAPVDTQTIQFDVTFTSFLAVFGGACEKYIPLFVMEGMEIHLQLENIQSAIMYQWVPWPTEYTQTGIDNTKCVEDAQGTHYPRNHYLRTNAAQSYAAVNATRAGAITEVVWSNKAGDGADANNVQNT